MRPERICLFVVSLNDRFIMCSICLANLALIAVSVTSAAGLAALAARMDAALSDRQRCSKLSRLNATRL